MANAIGRTGQNTSQARFSVVFYVYGEYDLRRLGFDRVDKRVREPSRLNEVDRSGTRWRNRGLRLQGALTWLAIACVTFLLVFSNPLATAAVRFSQESTVGGTVIYGTLRTLSSVMSVAKDADITGSAAVASATFSPGQLLEPVTNTIDRIADLLFMLIIGSGLVAALTTSVAKIGAAVAFVSALSLSAMRAMPALRHSSAEGLLRSLFFLGIIATAGIPGAFAGAAVLGDNITRSAWQNATDAFRGMETQIDAGGNESTIAASAAISSLREPAEAQEDNVSSDEGVIDGTFARIGSAWSASRNAVSNTAKAATSLAASIRDQAASNVKIIRNGVAFSSHLLDASVQIAVAYLAKLVILPSMIFAAAIFLLRSVALPTFHPNVSRNEHE